MTLVSQRSLAMWPCPFRLEGDLGIVGPGSISPKPHTSGVRAASRHKIKPEVPVPFLRGSVFTSACWHRQQCSKRTVQEAANRKSHDSTWAVAWFYTAALITAGTPAFVAAAKELLLWQLPRADVSQWLLLSGECGPAVASLLLLLSAARTGNLRAQTPKRLHVSIVLAFLIAGVILLGSASTTTEAVVLASVGCVGAVLTALGVGGALIYLPFDLPTALSLWLFPRMPRRFKFTLGSAISGTFTVFMVCAFARAVTSVAVFTLELANGSSTALGTLHGLRGAASVVAVFTLALVRDGAWRRRQSRRVQVLLALGLLVYGMTTCASFVGVRAALAF